MKDFNCIDEGATDNAPRFYHARQLTDPGDFIVDSIGVTSLSSTNGFGAGMWLRGGLLWRSAGSSFGSGSLTRSMLAADQKQSHFSLSQTTNE
jgi:hypothetical protein